MKNPLGDLNVGVVLALVGGVLLVITLALGWSTWNRWSGISAISSARLRLLQANDGAVKTRSSQAAHALPKEAAAVLLDTDLTSDADYARLETLEQNTSSADVPLVQVAEALSLVLRGKDPSHGVGGSDGALISAIADLTKSGQPHPIVLDKNAPPHHAVMLCAYVKQLRAALAVGDRDLIQEAARILAMLVPAHADGPALRFITAILDPAVTLEMLSQVASRVPDPQRKRIAHLMASIAHERANELAAISLGVPPQTPPAQLLPAQVAAASSQDGDVDRVSLVRRCLDAGRYDLAKTLLPKMPQIRQAELRNIILNQEGNLSDLVKAGAVDPALMPRLSNLRARPGFVAFHISNDLGMIPKTKVTVRFNGNDIESAGITQNGSLFSVTIPTLLSGSSTLEVLAGTDVLATKQVTL